MRSGRVVLDLEAAVSWFGGGRIAAIFALVLIATQPARATEGGGSNYALGIQTVVPGFVVAEPGINLFAFTAYYTANRVNNRLGQSALPRFHVDASVTTVRLDYAFGEKFLGASWGIQLAQPVADLNIERRIGSNFAKDSKSGLGDTAIAPLAVSWNGVSPIGRWSMGFRTLVIAPTGDYRVTDLANLGRNYVSVIPSFAASLITPSGGHVGFQANYIYNTINPATRYRSGDEFDIDFGIGQTLFRNVWLFTNVTLEANGYYYKQIENDTRFGQVVGSGSEGRVLGLGPQLRLGLPGNAGLVIKWQHEMLVRNRPQGDRFWAQLFVPLGPVQTTAPAGGSGANVPARTIESYDWLTRG